MHVTSSDLFVAYNAAFANGQLNRANLVYDQVSTEIRSTTSMEQYDWLTGIPFPREWKGARVVKGFSTRKYTITNRDFELSIGIDRNVLRDQTLDHMTRIPSFQEMGRKFMVQREKDVMNVYATGTTAAQTCYDGQPLFSGAHPRKSGSSFSNDDSTGAEAPIFFLAMDNFIKPVIHQIRQEPNFEEDRSQEFNTRQIVYGADDRRETAPGLWESAYRSNSAFSEALIDTVQEAASLWEDDEGEKLGVQFTHVLCPTSRMGEVMNVLNRQLINGGESNRSFGRLTPIFSPYL
ncbi:MAG: Mu-like prophage major head subunit gpT family protein [Myxococcota bacterium]